MSSLSKMVHIVPRLVASAENLQHTLDESRSLPFLLLLLLLLPHPTHDID